MTQPDLFLSPYLNQLSGAELKERGIKRVAEKNEAVLEAMRAKAHEICMEKGSCTSDEIREWADSLGFNVTHKNAYGAIFRNGEFEAIGWKESTRESNHSRPVRVWRIRTNRVEG